MHIVSSVIFLRNKCLNTFICSVTIYRQCTKNILKISAKYIKTILFIRQKRPYIKTFKRDK